ncbi:MAG: HNH endonuclease [Aestuariivirga sp.]|nr:HNH endonuclease [Aestuariivirga sp.]
MVKAVLTTKVSPSYDDLPEVRYHFPKTYLNQMQRAVGDWIVYYEPRRSTESLASTGGRQAYFATARIERIVPDPALQDHYYAEVSNFLPFVQPVSFREGEHYFESLLQKPDGSTSKGAFGRAVRNLPDAEFDMIWQAGFGHIIGLAPRERPGSDVPEEPLPYDGFAETAPDFLMDVPMEQDRRIIEQLVLRPFRDRAFSAAVKTAYHDTCAMTGLKIINGGGRSEVQAAHIRPVELRGPDSVRNGLALSATVHWIFDRGLVSVDENFGLLLAQNRIPDTVGRILNTDRKLRLPDRIDLRPHQQFLEFHRREIFKG